MATTSGQFQKYIDALKIERPCELCAHNEWQIPSDGADSKSNVSRLTLTGTRLSAYFPAYSLVCGHCGNTKLFMATQVDAWVEANG